MSWLLRTTMAVPFFFAQFMKESATFSWYLVSVIIFAVLHHILYPLLAPVVKTFAKCCAPIGYLFAPIVWWFSLVAGQDTTLWTIFLGDSRLYRIRIVFWWQVRWNTIGSLTLKRDDPSLYKRRSFRRYQLLQRNRCNSHNGRIRHPVPQRFYLTGGFRLTRLRAYCRRSGILDSCQAEPWCCQGHPVPMPSLGLLMHRLRLSHWSFFTAPYNYFATKARKPPDINEMKTVLTVITMTLIPLTISVAFMRACARMIVVTMGWLRAPTHGTTAVHEKESVSVVYVESPGDCHLGHVTYCPSMTGVQLHSQVLNLTSTTLGLQPAEIFSLFNGRHYSLIHEPISSIGMYSGCSVQVFPSLKGGVFLSAQASGRKRTVSHFDQNIFCSIKIFYTRCTDKL